MIRNLSFLAWSIFLLIPYRGWSLRPMECPIALAAGEGTAGFRDGTFTSAYFNKPYGIAVSPDGSKLYVADSANNRIRVVHLDDKNRVSTLVGGDKAGWKDGSLDQAQLNDPYSVACLPGDRLVIYDHGNKLLRLADLARGTLSTLAGGPKASLAQGPATQVAMDGLRDMVYLPGPDALFFTQPAQGTLKYLDLKSQSVSLFQMPVSNVLEHPGPLGAQADQLYVADKITNQVFLLDWKDGALSPPVLVATAPAPILALAKGADGLYALQASEDVPIQRLAPAMGPVTFMSVWGDSLPQIGERLFNFTGIRESAGFGFAADPLDARKIYCVNPKYNLISVLRDANPDADYSAHPVVKPPHTFRILMVGDSRLVWSVNYNWPTDFDKPTVPYPPQVVLAKRLELALNSLASLEDQPVNYEVMTMSHSGSIPLFLWPCYEVPDVVKKYDIDMVLIFQPNTPHEFAYRYYFMTPLTKDGIPQLKIDPEYLLKPPKDRIPPGEPKRFYEYCRSHQLVKEEGTNLLFDEKLFLDPQLHDMLVDMYGKPASLLSQSLSGVKTSQGDPVRMLLCSLHTGIFRQNLEDPAIWSDLADRFHIPFLDLNEEATAMRLSFFPLNEIGNNDHLNPTGHFFFGLLLAHDLIGAGAIPWRTPVPPAGGH